MPRPGVTTQVLDEATPVGAALHTGTGMIVGIAEKGPANTPTKIVSFRKYKETFGSLAGGADMYKAAYGFFQEGGMYLWVVRAVNNGAVPATATIDEWLDIEASSPGVWGNTVTVDVEPQGLPTGNNSAKFVVKVYEDGTLKEQSVPLVAEEVASYRSLLVVLTEVDAPVYPVGDAPTMSRDLAGGDDAGGPDIGELATALDTLRYDLGPAQVGVPGRSEPEVHELLDAHCAKYHRVACADLPDSADPAALFSAVQAIADCPGKGKQILSLGQVMDYPGEVAPAVWEVPYSGIQMGIIARVDALNDPSQVAAGSLGYSRLAIGPKRDFTDDEREDLNYAGVTLAKVINNQVRTYGYRTSAGLEETNWVFFQESRVIMAITHESDAILEEFVLKTIDGRGRIFGRVNVALTGVCQRYWKADALFGETPGEAFIVDTSYPGINTIETVAAGEIHAQLRLRTSRVAEWVVLDIVKYPLERSIAA
jgi:hypothetical protein